MSASICHACKLSQWRGKPLPLTESLWFGKQKMLCPNCSAVQNSVELETYKLLKDISDSPDIPLLPRGSKCLHCGGEGKFDESSQSLHFFEFFCRNNPEHGSWVEER